MIKKIIFTVTAFVFLFLFASRASAAQLFVNYTPAGDAIWDAGTTQTVSWHYPQTSYYQNTNYTFGLFAMGSDGQPITHDNGFSVFIYDYPAGVVTNNRVSQASGSITLPASIRPGKYKIVVQWGQVSVGLGGSDIKEGVITVNNTSYFSVPIPTLPVVWPQGTRQSTSVTYGDFLGVPGELMEGSINVNLASGGQTVLGIASIRDRLPSGAGGYISSGVHTQNQTVDIPTTIPIGPHGIRILTEDGRISFDTPNRIYITPPVSTKFVVGDRVRTNFSATRVYPLDSRSVFVSLPLVFDTQPGVVFGTVANSDLVWNAEDSEWMWQIDFDSGADGLVREIHLDKIIISPPTLTIALPEAGDTWVVGDINQAVRWTSTGIPPEISMRLQRMPAPGNPAPAGLMTPIGLNDGAWPLTSVPNYPGRWYYVLTTSGSLAVAESGIFTIVEAPVIPVCGNNVIESGEQCDGANLDNPRQTCSDQGFSTGTLSCNSSCQFNTSQCVGSGGNDDFGDGGAPGWQAPRNDPPDCTDPAIPGCNPPINVGPGVQDKAGPLRVTGLRSFSYSLFDDDAFFYTKVRSNAYCDYNGDNCYPILDLVGGGGGGVSQIIAGSNVTISPPGGTGAVTINSSGGGGTLPTCSANQILKWVGSAWTCAADEIGATGTGDITAVLTAADSGLTGGTSAGEADLKLNKTGLLTGCGDVTTGKVYWDGTKFVCGTDNAGAGTYSFTVPANSGLKNQTDPATTVTSGDSVSLRDCTDGQVLKWNNSLTTTSKWVCADGVSKIIAGNNITISSSPTGGIGDVTIKNTTYAVPDNSTLTSTFTESPAGSSVGYNTFAIKDGGVTTAKIADKAVTYNKIFIIPQTMVCSATEGAVVTCDPQIYNFCVADHVLPDFIRTDNTIGKPNCAVYYENRINEQARWRIRVKGGTDGNLFANTKYNCYAVCF